MSQINVRNLSNENDDGAPDIVGVSTFSATSYFVPPVGTTAQRPDNPQGGDLRFNTDTASLEYFKGDTLGWSQIEMTSPDLDGGARALFSTGYISGSDYTDRIDSVTISTLGDAVDFGNVAVNRFYTNGFASRIRGYTVGGQAPSLANGTNAIEYVTISSFGNGTDFGDLDNPCKYGMSFSSSTRGVTALGHSPSPTSVNTMEYITLGTSGTGVDFGDTTGVRNGGAACASSTRGIIWGGVVGPGYGNAIDYVTTATTGNASDFGDLIKSRSNIPASFSNSTRGIIAGGFDQPYTGDGNSIYYITIATTGNATDFGDTAGTGGKEFIAGASSPTRGLVVGGQSGPTSYNNIDYITIQTTGNAVDFGDLSEARFGLAGCSNAHGGL